MIKKLKELYAAMNSSKGDLRWLLQEGKGTLRYMLGFLLISMISMGFSLISPYISKLVVDSVSGANPRFDSRLILLMLGSTLLSLIFSSISRIFNSYVREKFSFSVRAKMFDRTQRGRWLNISKFHSGDMMVRLGSDVSTIAGNIITLLPDLIVSVLQLVVILIIVWSVDPTLALIGLIAGPAGILITLAFRAPSMRLQKEMKESDSEYFTFFQENLSNIGMVKSFQLEDRNNTFFEKFRARRLKTVMKRTYLGICSSTCSRLVYTFAYILAFTRCARQLQAGLITYGTMTMFLSQMGQIQGAVRNVGSVLPTLFTTVISTRRVREITEQGVEDLSGSHDPIPSSVGLRVEHMSFTYQTETVLKDVSFEIPAGAHVGIIGSSGAGKTTLIRLLLALTEPDRGTVEYVFPDGTTEAASPASRRLLSYVPQGNTLLTGSLRKNMLSGDPNATEEMMWRALELADAADFVRKDPKGLNLSVTERSGGISAGQAQRVCIARAIIRDRPVMIFDEATSALDEKTERRIFENLISTSDKTCLIITHRSSMLRYCDTVMSVDDDGHVRVWKQNA